MYPFKFGGISRFDKHAFCVFLCATYKRLGQWRAWTPAVGPWTLPQDFLNIQPASFHPDYNA